MIENMTVEDDEDEQHLMEVGEHVLGEDSGSSKSDTHHLVPGYSMPGRLPDSSSQNSSLLPTDGEFFFIRSLNCSHQCDVLIFSRR